MGQSQSEVKANGGQSYRLTQWQNTEMLKRLPSHYI
jgi:hypothetical protein